MNIIWKGTPNYTPGRSRPITKVVMHWMAGTLASTDATFADEDSQVSAHYGIENEVIHQYVRDGDTAWHAAYGGVTANPYSIGIEHSAAPGRDATASTIATSAQLLAEVCQRHNIACNRGNVIKHSEVIATQCPGTIPIDDIINKANQIIAGEDEMPNSGDATNFIRGQRGDPAYNPTQAEIDAAMKVSYKDWAYALGFPNPGDATNYIRADKGNSTYNPTQAEKNQAAALSHKGWAYKFMGRVGDYVPFSQTVYVKK